MHLGTAPILVVDDDQSVRQLLCAVLRRSGYPVIEAGSGEDALELFAQECGKIALLITDVVMPGITGPELARQLQRSQPQLPVLLISGFDGGEDLRRGFPLIPKPFATAEIVRRVRDML